jgi:hypothetical protein
MEKLEVTLQSNAYADNDQSQMEQDEYDPKHCCIRASGTGL